MKCFFILQVKLCFIKKDIYSPLVALNVSHGATNEIPLPRLIFEPEVLYLDLKTILYSFNNFNFKFNCSKARLTLVVIYLFLANNCQFPC